MTTLNIETRQHGDITYYCFTANQTNYTVNQEKDGRWSVWSERGNARFGLKIKVYRDLDELSKRSKALAQFARLMEAGQGAAH